MPSALSHTRALQEIGPQPCRAAAGELAAHFSRIALRLHREGRWPESNAFDVGTTPTDRCQEREVQWSMRRHASAFMQHPFIRDMAHLPDEGAARRCIACRPRVDPGALSCARPPAVAGVSGNAWKAFCTIEYDALSLKLYWGVLHPTHR